MPETIHDHLVKLVIPFHFECSYQDALSRINETGSWNVGQIDPHDLFLHIKKLVSDAEESIGRYYSLSDAFRSQENFPGKKDTIIELCKEQPEGQGSSAFFIRLVVSALHLFLFETGVGIFVVDVKYVDPVNICVVARANFYLKKIGDKKNDSLSYAYMSEGNRIVKEEFPMVSFISATVSSFGDYSFFESGNAFLRHCYVFSYFILDLVGKEKESRNDFISTSLFRLSKGVHCNLYPPADQFNTKNYPSIISFVDHIIWGIAQEGVSCIGYITHDEQSDHFLRKYFPKRVQDSYFYLYILAMVQRFSLISLAQKTSKILTKFQQPIQNLKHYDPALQLIYELQEDIPLYGLRVNFSQVSHNSHSTLFYEELKSVLRIEQLHSELDTEVKNIGSVIALYEQKKQKIFELRIAVVAIVFALISVLSDGLGFFSIMGWFEAEFPVCSLSRLIFIVVILLYFVWLLLKKTGFFSFGIRKKR
jgi:hypothetical protein